MEGLESWECVNGALIDGANLLRYSKLKLFVIFFEILRVCLKWPGEYAESVKKNI